MRDVFRILFIFILFSLLIFLPRPLAGKVQQLQGARLEKTGEYTQAAASYLAAARRLPWQPDLWEKAGTDFLRVKDFHQADAAYRQASQAKVLSPTGSMNWGDARSALGDTQTAITMWTGLLQQKSADATLLLPRIAARYQTLEAGSTEPEEIYPLEIRTLQEYLALKPEDAQANYRLGLLLVAGTPVESLPYLLKAAELDPAVDQRVQDLRTVINTAALSNDKAYQFLMSGRALGNIGEWKLAASAFQLATLERPDYADAWAWLAEARQQTGQNGTAEIEKAVSMPSPSAMVESLYGVYLQRQNQPVKALSAFQAAASLEPENPGWQMALGRAYELTDDLISALDHYRHATELAPQDPSTWRALADFCLRDGVDLTGTALPAARRLVELAKDDWRSLDLAGEIIDQTGDSAGAEILLKRAAELDPAQAAPILHLGVLYLEAGDRQAAYPYLVKAREMDPDGVYGWQARRLLEQYFP